MHDLSLFRKVSYSLIIYFFNFYTYHSTNFTTTRNDIKIKLFIEYYTSKVHIMIYYSIIYKKMNPNGSLTINNMFLIHCEISNYDINIPFNNQITDSIRIGTAVAASDASIKNHYIGGY